MGSEKPFKIHFHYFIVAIYESYPQKAFQVIVIEQLDVFN